MSRSIRRPALATSTAVMLVLAGCSATGGEAETSAAPTAEAETGRGTESEASAAPLTLESNLGAFTLEEPAESIVLLDNRAFRLAEEWGVTPSAAARELIRPDLEMRTDESIPNVGNHREPNLEMIVAAEPDLVISGQRFTSFNEQIAALVPDAVVVDFSPRDGEPFAEELRRHTTAMGQLLGHEEEAATLVEEFDAAIARATAAYEPTETVMAVITSGGEINYAAPFTGRSLGPIFEMIGLTPALEVDNSSTDHEGDDISVEAIADSNPDWLIVMDRDAAVGANSGEVYTPAAELLADSAALQNVTAVQQDQIVYMPQYTYLDEGIQTYTEFLTILADAMEAN